MFKIEMFKILRKKEFVIIACTLIMPIAFALLFAFAPGFIIQYPFGGLVPRLPFAVTTMGFFSTFGIYGILFGILSTTLISGEIASHYTLLYFPRLTSRKRMFSAKLNALALTAFVWFVLFSIVSLLSYSLVTLGPKEVTSGAFTDESTLYWVMNLICMLFDLLFYVSVISFLGLYLSPMVNILVSLVVVYGSTFLYSVPILGYLLPAFYQKSAMDQVNLQNYSGLIWMTVGCVLVSSAYFAAAHIFGRKKISKLEL